jgi:FixJ family two-component response regulator
MLHRNRVDAVFLDLQLPVMTGPDFLRELRSDHMDVPVTLITGYPDSDLVVEAGRYGPVTLLVKPIKRGQLIQAVRNMLPGSVQFSE